MICIFSTLRFVRDQSIKLHLKTHVITLDQPLSLKASKIVNAKCVSIVLILGDFHLMMSYWGCLGGLMKGAGLKEVFHFIYGVNAVEHVLFGKAVSRVLRDHFILESALTTNLLKKIIVTQRIMNTNQKLS